MHAHSKNRRPQAVKKSPSTYRYIIAYKPDNVLSSLRDRHERATLATMGVPLGLQPAGRLDLDSEGLLLITDDGPLLHRVTHPNYHHSKTYLVLVLGHPDDAALQQLRDGVEIKFGLTRPAEAEVLSSAPHLPPFPRPLPRTEKTTWLRMVLYEGKKRQIKRMTAAVGHPTLRLVRIAIGPIELPATLKPGQWRDLSPLEQSALFDWLWPHGRPVKRTSTYRARRKKH